MLGFDIIINNIRYNNVESLTVSDNSLIVVCAAFDKDGKRMIHKEKQYERTDKTWISNIENGKIVVTFDNADIINRFI